MRYKKAVQNYGCRLPFSRILSGPKYTGVAINTGEPGEEEMTRCQ
jgi:hypothetical protein